MRIDRHSIKFKIWLYFMIFAFAIILGLWLFQIVFLNSYYENIKQQNILQGAARISEIYGNQAMDEAKKVEEIEAVVSQYDLFANIINMETGQISSFSPLQGLRLSIGFIGDFLTDSRVQLINSLAQEIEESENGRFLKLDSSEEGGAYILGEVIGRGNSQAILVATSRLQPLDDTMMILSNQLIYVAVIVLAAAVGAALLIATRVSRPLEEITVKAKELSEGNYDVRFDKGKYAEIDQLAHTLNYATEGLQQVEKLRTELIANVSHDLKTPLTMIKAYAEMIRDISGNNEEKRNKHLNIIVEESDRMTALVQDLLDVSKLQAGVVEYHPMPFDLVELIKTVRKRFDGVCRQRGFSIDLQFNKECYAIGDMAKIQQVVYNLLSNAVNYSGDSREIQVTITAQEGKVRVAVTDHGEGISQEDIPYIWDRYYKVDKNHERAVVGTGIGLSIVKSVLELHQAAYGVESELGKGSTFWFELKEAADD